MRTIICFGTMLVLISACAITSKPTSAPPRPIPVLTKNMGNPPTFIDGERWEIEVTDPPEGATDSSVWIHLGDGKREILMSRIGNTNRYFIVANDISAPSFRIHFDRHYLRDVGNGLFTDHIDYCGAIRMYSDRGSSNCIHEERVRFSAVMSTPTGRDVMISFQGKISKGGTTELKGKNIELPPWQPIVCTYAPSFKY